MTNGLPNQQLHLHVEYVGEQDQGNCHCHKEGATVCISIERLLEVADIVEQVLVSLS